MILGGEDLSVSRTPRIGDWVYQRLREGIILGDVEPGERLRQSLIAEQFDVSQTPVREALARLASDGLVTLHPHRGAVVNSLSTVEIDQIYELREVLDPYTARQTAGSASDAELNAVRDAAEACAEPGLNSTQLFERNRLFHLALYEGCGNERMVQLFESLWDSVTAIRMFDVYVSDPDEAAKMNDEHTEIAAAVCARDGERAAKLVYEHIASARRDLLELLADEPASEPSEDG